MNHVPGPAAPRRVVFVCWGNICRSPMAERVAQKMAPGWGLDDVVFTSGATSSEEIGHPIDPRARRVLERAGYRSGGHRAHRVTAAEVEGAELVLGMESLHLDLLRRLVPGADNLALLTDFDPDRRGQPVDDPWYGPESGFLVTLRTIEAAMPGLLRHLRG